MNKEKIHMDYADKNDVWNATIKKGNKTIIFGSDEIGPKKYPFFLTFTKNNSQYTTVHLDDEMISILRAILDCYTPEKN